MAKTIPARYPSKACKKCKRPIDVGEPVTRCNVPGYNKHAWIHAQCAIDVKTPQPPAGNEPSPWATEPAEPQPAQEPATDATPAEPTTPGNAKPQEPAQKADAMPPLETTVRAIAREESETVFLEGAELIKADIAEIVKDLPTGAARNVSIKVADRPTVDVDLAHAALEDVVSLAAQRLNVLLVGPSGCGKTFLAAQVADVLGLPFSTISCTGGMSEGQLLGRLLPTGAGGQFEYHSAPFVDLYENGGVFLLDEVDAADENTLLTLNQGLANGRLPLPHRTHDPIAKRHPDFVCIAAANTFGTGADRVYVGRNQLDDATLDRFRIGTIDVDYSEAIEEALCPDATLRQKLQGFRTAARANKLRRVISTRFLEQAALMSKAGWSHARIEQALFSGWSEDERKAVGA